MNDDYIEENDLIEASQNETSESSTQADQPEKPKRKRGRPKKAKTKAKAKSSTTKKRGRPKKISNKKEPSTLIEKDLEENVSKSITFSKNKKPQKSHTNFQPLFFLGIFMALIAVFGYLFYAQNQKLTEESLKSAESIKTELGTELSEVQKQFDELNQKVKEQEVTLQQDNQIPSLEYINQEAGISFSYAEDLGVINEQLISLDENNEEQILSITFSKNADIWLVFAPNSSNEDSELFNQIAVYPGNISDLYTLCKNPLAIDENGFCDNIEYNMTPMVKQITPIIENDELSGNILTIKSNLLASDKYKGASINVNLGLPPTLNRNPFAPVDESNQVESQLDFYRSIVKNHGLSLVISKNLEYLQVILDSLVINQ